MCERKPGPRCSPDSLKVLEKLTEKVTQLNAEYDEANDEVMNYWGNNHGELDALYMVAGVLQQDLREAEAKLKQSELTYNATPDGIRNLQEALAAAGDETVTRDYSKISIDDDEPEYTEGDVTFPKVYEIRNSLEAAEAHRAWQRGTLNTLAETEKTSVDNAVFIAQGIRGNLEKTLKEIKADNIPSTHRIYDAISENKINPTDENKNEIISLVRRRERKLLHAAYLRMRINDLKSYEKDMLPKITSNVVEIGSGKKYESTYVPKASPERIYGAYRAAKRSSPGLLSDEYTESTETTSDVMMRIAEQFKIPMRELRPLLREQAAIARDKNKERASNQKVATKAKKRIQKRK